ncbi:MAG: putative mannose-6-phosphate isomerase [Nevskia sp.]|jgi:mannose-6-phosphate isomerase-like protein (cupin superfamily)|nr:putative mannose-6-phosphate isomerase [Nevskia sp.]
MGIERIIDPKERDRAHAEVEYVNFYSEAVKQSEAFRKEYDGYMNVVKSSEMPLERSPDGLLKHIIHEQMNTKEMCLDIYMHFIPSGKKSGKHRHLSEEVFYVVEGSGYDLHWDVKFDCADTIEFEWEKEPKKFEWTVGDFVYIPPYCAHQHFSTGPGEARIVVMNSRIVKAMGFDWFEQLENCDY